MQQLETTKGKSVVIPRLVKRYTILCYREGSGWQTGYALHTTPESALEQFLDTQNRYTDKNIKFYKVFEVELEIPFVPKEDL